MPTVVVVDDEADVRFLVRWLIEEAPGGWCVVGEAVSADEAVSRWRELRPDFVVTDQRLQGSTGMEAAERILAENPVQPVVLLSMIDDEELEEAAHRLGVAMCLSKVKLPDLPGLLAQLARDPGN